jgi:hypothetical protein
MSNEGDPRFANEADFRLFGEEGGRRDVDCGEFNVELDKFDAEGSNNERGFFLLVTLFVKEDIRAHA